MLTMRMLSTICLWYLLVLLTGGRRRRQHHHQQHSDLGMWREGVTRIKQEIPDDPEEDPDYELPDRYRTPVKREEEEGAGGYFNPEDYLEEDMHYNEEEEEEDEDDDDDDDVWGEKRRRRRRKPRRSRNASKKEGGGGGGGGAHACDECGKTYKYLGSLNKHMQVLIRTYVTKERADILLYFF